MSSSSVVLSRGDAEAQLHAVRAATDRGDIEGATRLAASLYAAGLREPLQLNLLAHQAETAGAFERALGLLQEALEIAPHDANVLHGVGLCLSQMERRAEAMVAFDAALMQRPGYPAAHHHRGLARQMLGDDDGAERDFLAAARDPAYADPRSGLALLAQRAGHAAEARTLADEALALDPRQATASRVLAALDTADGRPEDAEIRLRELLLRDDLQSDERFAATLLLADALDAQGRYDQAFAAYAEGKQLAGEVYEKGEGRGMAAAHRELIGRLHTWFARSAPWERARSDEASPVRRHVILLGFPRSGTTLLEQVLASHSEVVTLDERPLLDPVALDYFNDSEALAKFSTLDGPELAREREAYWKGAADLGLKLEGKVLLDKFPLHTVKLPVISRLFPDAVVLFAERDPRDVVLSVFRRNFRMNPAMAQFTSLVSAARYYDAVMSLAEVYAEKLPVVFTRVRHERLVTDFEPEVRRICGAIGLEWEAGMSEFAERAKTRAIRTPSAAQVRRGLYTDALGHWRRYERQLEPVMPILRPWVERLGYAEASFGSGEAAS